MVGVVITIIAILLYAQVSRLDCSLGHLKITLHKDLCIAQPVSSLIEFVGALIY